ncbi:adhesion G-protein coupled receptor G6-like [Pomacea canaliculata]|uniref:adhesion G-protein coupled receptor G6-like n=1 Tax=Pomacea canaliculata TaxID=400727 RepID=UPI000D726CD0|nr:adhesion G-protein coupled receptor G6-like [Pomacea canaliculata]
MDFAQTPHVRYVTPNIAMELWNLGKTRETVIGFGATTDLNGTSILSESRILTIKNRTWAELHLENFDVAIELPDQVVMDPSTETVGMRLSMTIFRKPGLFLSSEQVETSVPRSPHVNSPVISAAVDGRKIKNLEQKVKLVFKPEKMSDRGATRCVFWDFGRSGGGGWSSSGCTFNGTVRGRHICLCDHLTNFAVLLDFYGDTKSFGEKDNNALSMITIVGVTLSMLSLTCTIFTFIIFKKLRKGRAQQTLFNLSLALLCSQAILLIGLKQTTHYGVCLVVAVLLHYFIMASFMWMMVEAVLQYLIFVKILGTYISRYTLKTMVSAWGVPVIPVVTVLCIDYRQYRGRRDYCWMELEAFYYAFALPVGVIMVFNFALFTVIMSSLMRRPMAGLRNTKNKHSVAETNIKAAFTIFVLLGLTWIFGYLAIEDARLPFQYLFTTLNSLQGVFIFVLLIARRRQVREHWKLLCCRLMSPINRKEKVSATRSSSLSSSFSGSSLATNRKTFSIRSYSTADKSSPPS